MREATAYTIETEPQRSAPLLTLAALKEHLRVQHDDEDALIESLAYSAEDLISTQLTMPMRRGVWQAIYSHVDERLYVSGPTFGIVRLEVEDDDGAWVEVEPTLYNAVASAECRRDAQIDFTYEFYTEHCSARTRRSPHEGIRVRVTVNRGYADGEVPTPLLHAVRLIVGEWYEHREAASPFPRVQLPVGVKALLEPYREHRI